MKKDRFGRARVLSTAELDLLLEALPENHRVLATLLRRTAARVSEGLQLKWRYVADGYVLLTAPTTKGGKKTRSVPIHPQLAAELAAWKQVVNPDNDPDQWVFPGRNPGEHLTRRGFDHALRKAASELGYFDALIQKEFSDCFECKWNPIKGAPSNLRSFRSGCFESVPRSQRSGQERRCYGWCMNGPNQSQFNGGSIVTTKSPSLASAGYGSSWFRVNTRM